MPANQGWFYMVRVVGIEPNLSTIKSRVPDH